MKLFSTAFSEGEEIPIRYTCDDQNISPPLEWADVPIGTQSFVLIMDDPDAPAGTWVHWVIYDLPASEKSLEENISSFPKGTKIGLNSGKKAGYGGPCPPDKRHRYFFKLYALDIPQLPHLSKQATKADVEQAMTGHILTEASLMGTYDRPFRK
jgi:Raf kinase inhibitor-like YbhB/YbcL family protein